MWSRALRVWRATGGNFERAVMVLQLIDEAVNPDEVTCTHLDRGGNSGCAAPRRRACSGAPESHGSRSHPVRSPVHGSYADEGVLRTRLVANASTT
jgi:hypothetical protein